MSRRIVDAHNHPNWCGKTAAGIVTDMDEKGIAQTWLLACEAPAEEMDVVPRYYEKMDPRSVGLPLDRVTECLQAYPDRFIGGWAPDPRRRHARARLKAAIDLHGIRVYGELKLRMRYDEPDAIALYRFCGESGMPVLFHLEAPAYRLKELCGDIHAWPEWYGGDIAVVENLCRACPETVFIAHGPGWWREFSTGDGDRAAVYPDGPVQPGGHVTRILRACPKLHADLSGTSGLNALARDPGHAFAFIGEFQDRLLFGRDGFGSDLIEFLNTLALDDETMDKILCRNADRLARSDKETQHD